MWKNKLVTDKIWRERNIRKVRKSESVWRLSEPAKKKKKMISTDVNIWLVDPTSRENKQYVFHFSKFPYLNPFVSQINQFSV